MYVYCVTLMQLNMLICIITFNNCTNESSESRNSKILQQHIKTEYILAFHALLQLLKLRLAKITLRIAFFQYSELSIIKIFSNQKTERLITSIYQYLFLVPVFLLQPRLLLTLLFHFFQSSQSIIWRLNLVNSSFCY